MAVAREKQLIEVKRTLDGEIIEYPAERLLVEPGVRVVLLCRIDEPELVAGGRMTLAPGTLSVGHFWFNRPYNVYHWLYGGETLLYYINIGRLHSLSERALVWDDYAVDILAYPDGRSLVIDEDEIPDSVDGATRTFIAESTAAVLADLNAIVGGVRDETRSLVTTRCDVGQL